MAENVAGEYIARLKAILKISRDEDLAATLGIGKSTIASWRIRGNLPKAARDRYKEKFGLDHDEIKRAHLNNIRRDSHLLRAAIMVAVLRLGRTSPPESDAEWAAWLATNYFHLIDEIAPADLDQEPGRDGDVLARAFLDVVSKRRLTPERLYELKAARPEVPGGLVPQ